MDSIDQIEVGGLRVVWAAVPGPLTATLLVRTGRADETLPTLGLSHLVEHLALWPMRKRRHAYGGWVEDAVTAFGASGRADEVVGFLEALSSSLRTLPVDRLPTERKVLRAEGVARGGDIYAHLLALRFGAAGYGLGNFHEFGIDWLDAGVVRNWAAERFTAQNSVLWLSGEPPDDLRVSLPSGAAVSAPRPEAIPSLDLPAELDARVDGVTLTLVGERSSSLHAAFAIASERARVSLREDAGLSYAPTGDYRPLDGETAHLFLTADCRRPDAARVRAGLVRTLDDLASDGPTSEELDDDRRMLARHTEDPDDPRGRLDSHSRELLFSRDPPTPDDLMREREELTPDTVAAALADAMQTLLVVVPSESGADRGRTLPPYAPYEPEIIEGQRFGTSEEWKGFNLDSELVLNDRGLAFTHGYTTKEFPGKTTVAMEFASCVAAASLPSGGLTLFARDGATVTLHPERLVGGAAAIDRIQLALDDGLMVPMSESEQAVARFARDHLESRAIGRLGGELDVLPYVLGQDETPVLACEARRRFQNPPGGQEDRQVGLLTITNSRLVFLFNGAGGTELYEAPVGLATAATKRGLKKRLVVSYEGETAMFDNIQPAERTDEIIERMQTSKSD